MSCSCSTKGNQFFYTRLEEVKVPKVENTYSSSELPYIIEKEERMDSFNVEMVIRTIDYGKDGRLVVLSDFHEEMRDVPEVHPRTRKATGVFKKERNTYSSEILLSKADGDKFVNFIN